VERVASSSENFLLFGANVDETCSLVKAYFTKLVADITYLESKVHEISGVKVEFILGEMPNDLKMLSFLAGELRNSATFFLTFANVSLKDCNDYRKTYGRTKEHLWKP